MVEVSKANLDQVGGSHYNLVATQHWDLVAANKMPYFEAQITRYVTRWKKKNGAQDVEKALHYLRKLRELMTNDENDPTHLENPYPRPTLLLNEFIKENQLSVHEALVFQILLCYTSVNELDYVEELINEIHTQALEREANGGN